MAKNYPKIIDFGAAMNPQVESPLNPANPLTYCLFPTLNSQFIHGSSSSGLLYDTNNASCTNFMAERCKYQWDGFCDAYQQINVDTYWPNTASVDSQAFELAQFFLQNRASVGDSLVRNTVYRRFIVPSCPISYEPFDPTVASSPKVTIYSNSKISSSHLQNLENVDHDPLVTKMMENPKVCFDVMARIYLGWLRNEPQASQLRGTKFLAYLNQYNDLFQRFFTVALPRLPSFQWNKVAPHWDRTCPV